MIPFPLDLLGKGMGIHRQFHRPIIDDNGCRYSPFTTPTCGQTNRCIQQTIVQGSIPTRQSNINRCLSTISHTYWQKNRQLSIDNFTYLLVTEKIDRQFTRLQVTVIGIHRQCDIPIVRTIDYSADLSEPIGRRNSYRQPDSHTYTLYQFLSILPQAIGIDRQIRIPIEGVSRYRHAIPQYNDIPIGVFNSLLSRVCYTSKPLQQYSCRVYYCCITYRSVDKI